MASRSRTILQATLEQPAAGVVELASDWRGRAPPPFALCRDESCTILASLTQLPAHVYGFESGYFVDDENVLHFVVPLSRHEGLLDPAGEAVYLAGEFNGWNAIGREEWCLVPARVGGESVLLWTGPTARFPHAHRFKFVTGSGRWIEVAPDAPNAERDSSGNINRRYEPDRTGRHLYRFGLAAPIDLSAAWTVGWGDEAEAVPLRLGDFFFNLRTDHALGALVHGDETVFRIFAPRARRVELRLSADLDESEVHLYDLHRLPEAGGEWRGAWELVLDGRLHGWFYWYYLDAPRDQYRQFDTKVPVLDPYALATVGREGPGIVLDRAWIGQGDRGFRTPAWQDLVIAEAHVRDLAAHAPVLADPEERLGFSGLTRWVESPDFYLAQLGVNAVELQPVQEFDNGRREDYHWGYMTNNFFAPESSYCLAPEKASGVRELQALVAAFHRRGIAVILDVVYNHVGEPAHLMFVDKLYYFEVDRTGALGNWSGCGNDLRARSAMARRLIIDSLIHLVEAYGVDGFRFDLAELLGVEVLREVEKALKQVKPDIILIAEPWSFRGHIAARLRDTGFASWNDGYRDFLRDYVRGGSSRGTFEYHLKGSPWHFARWPAQTVNYTESHDDRTWIDVITENPQNNGFAPTYTDRRRTHLMAAVLFSSVGIPMIAEGQDFLRSKRGVNNTYLRGDLNALDYRRIYRYHGTHAYFADWIAFRLSEPGRLLRHYSRATESFFALHFAGDSNACAVVYNADRSQSETRLLFAINPTFNDVMIPLPPEVAAGRWQQLADVEQFHGPGSHGAAQPVEPELFVPALGCGLWISQ